MKHKRILKIYFCFSSLPFRWFSHRVVNVFVCLSCWNVATLKKESLKFEETFASSFKANFRSYFCACQLDRLSLQKLLQKSVQIFVIIPFGSLSWWWLSLWMLSLLSPQKSFLTFPSTHTGHSDNGEPAMDSEVRRARAQQQHFFRTISAEHRAHELGLAWHSRRHSEAGRAAESNSGADHASAAAPAGATNREYTQSTVQQPTEHHRNLSSDPAAAAAAVWLHSSTLDETSAAAPSIHKRTRTIRQSTGEKLLWPTSAVPNISFSF